MRHARRKRFPWVLVLCVATVGFAVGLFWAYIWYISEALAER